MIAPMPVFVTVFFDVLGGFGAVVLVTVTLVVENMTVVGLSTLVLPMTTLVMLAMSPCLVDVVFHVEPGLVLVRVFFTVRRPEEVLRTVLVRVCQTEATPVEVLVRVTGGVERVRVLMLGDEDVLTRVVAPMMPLKTVVLMLPAVVMVDVAIGTSETMAAVLLVGIIVLGVRIEVTLAGPTSMVTIVVIAETPVGMETVAGFASVVVTVTVCGTALVALPTIVDPPLTIVKPPVRVVVPPVTTVEPAGTAFVPFGGLARSMATVTVTGDEAGLRPGVNPDTTPGVLTGGCGDEVTVPFVGLGPLGAPEPKTVTVDVVPFATTVVTIVAGDAGEDCGGIWLVAAGAVPAAAVDVATIGIVTVDVLPLAVTVVTTGVCGDGTDPTTTAGFCAGDTVVVLYTPFGPCIDVTVTTWIAPFTVTVDTPGCCGATPALPAPAAGGDVVTV